MEAEVRKALDSMNNGKTAGPDGIVKDTLTTFDDDHHHLFAQNTIKVDSGYVNEQDRKAHCALTSAHITLTVERNTHSTIHGIGVKSIGLYQCWLAVEN